MMQKFYDRLKDDFLHKGSINIVCLGDSITEGCFEINTKKPFDAYPHKFMKLCEKGLTPYPNECIFDGVRGTHPNRTNTQNTERSEEP